MVDGRPLPISFQRSAGYCEQLDVHEPYATVREALEFSALLRQSREIPREEKLRYVDTVIDLLELHDMENSLIGRPGAGLSVEQRKRVTIGVELVAKPSILIFLDEPTSGLDGQAAFNTLRFLKKLAAAGQAVLCTIHQPSAQLFTQFDALLLLARGGKTVYFGDIGDNAATIKSYFERNGVPCPPEANPAEHIIDVVSGSLSKGRDWSQVWLDSPEHAKVTEDLDRMIEDAASSPPRTLDDGHEFAAPLKEQTKLVTHRMSIALYRNTEYIMNKFMLHILVSLFNGFSFWMIGHSVADLQLTLFVLFNFVFVAPGVIAQLQPLFIERRDLYEAREKKSKMYHWAPFVTGLIVSEMPYLVICTVFYFCLLLLHRGPALGVEQGRRRLLGHASLRVLVHRHRPVHRRVRAQCRLRVPGKPSRHCHAGQLLRRGGAVFADPALLALLAVLPQSIQISDDCLVDAGPLQQGGPLRRGGVRRASTRPTARRAATTCPTS